MPRLRGLIAGLAVVIVGGLTAWLILGRAARPARPHDSKSAATSKIAEATPQIATNAAPSAAAEPAATPKERPPQKVGEVRDGYILLPSGRLSRYANVHTNHMAALKPKCHIFRHFSENHIATVLALKPGQSLDASMMPNFNGKLTADFLESIKEPIVITDKDSEEDRELKKAMIAAKIELKDAYDRGEDIEKIIRDARIECQRLWEYTRTVESMTHKELRNCQTEEEMDDYIEAANKMLEQKGIAPLNPGRLMRVKMRMLQGQGQGQGN